MSNAIYDAVVKLTAIVDRDPIDWALFDEALLGLDDINIIDEEDEETILSEFVMGGPFFERGDLLLVAIQHFLSCGYDVLANDGRNGGLALSSLCWSSYDRHILDAAKMLMNAGAPVIYKSVDDGPGEEMGGLLDSIEWKIPGAWMVDKDYLWANVLEAYYSMAKAHVAKKDYNSVRCYYDCIGCTVTAVSASKGDSNQLHQDRSIRKFADSLIMWFDDKPLIINPYIEFVVDPVYVDDNKETFTDVSPVFSDLIGTTLVDVRYLDSTICYFEFSNGVRIIFASRDIGDRKRIGTFEIRPFEEEKRVEDLSIDLICGDGGFRYGSTVTDYDETALTFFCGSEAYVLHAIPGSKDKYQMKLCHCAKELLIEYTRQYPVHKPALVSCFYENNELTAMKFDYDVGHLYFKTTEHYAIQVQLSDDQYDPLDCLSLRSQRNGKHMEFQKRPVWSE